jgi:uncharacterized membrane protein YfcA
MTSYLLLIAFGIFVGVFSGLMGLGGGAVMIPIMVLAMGLEQAKAHGMSLMVMIPPVALPAVIGYFRAGKLETTDIWTAAFISFGLLCGSFFGAQIAIGLAKHKGALATCFGILLVYVAVYTALGKENITRSVVLSLVVTIVAAVVIVGVKWTDAKNRSTRSTVTSPVVDANAS